MKSPAVLNLPMPRVRVGSRSALLWCLLRGHLNYSAKPLSLKDVEEWVN